MYAQIEKSKENSFPTKRQKSRAVANSVAQKKSNVGQGFRFVDNRPEFVTQRKLQEMILSHAPVQMRQRGKTVKGRPTRTSNPLQGPRQNPPDREGPLRIAIQQANQIPNGGVGQVANVNAVIPNITTAHMYAAPISTQIANINGMRLDQQMAGNPNNRNMAIQNNVGNGQSQTFAAVLIEDGALNNHRQGEDRYALRMVKHAFRQSNNDRHLYRVLGQRAVMSQANIAHSQQQEMINANP